MGLNKFNKEKNIDIVLCIDATSSMGPCIDNVRRNATRFYQEFADKMVNEYKCEITGLRVQVIAFRDLECDTQALVKSEFFELPNDTTLFESFLNGIEPKGGGDYKESGLEALYTAMTTEWAAKRDGDRQVIVLFTDADAIDFTEKRDRIGYPNLFDESKFLTTWACATGNSNRLQERCKRLVMFAPAHSIYKTKIESKLNRSQLSVVTPQKGMSDISFDSIIKLICASVSTT